MASTDTLKDNTGFAKKNNASFPILADPDGTMSDAYGVKSSRGFAKRWTFYIDINGVIQKIDKSVSPASAGKDLVRNLQSLGYDASAS